MFLSFTVGDAALANMNSPEFFSPDKHELFSMRQLRSKGPYGDIYVAVNTVLNYECVVKKIAANTFDESTLTVYTLRDIL